MRSSPFVQTIEAIIIMVFIVILASCQRDQPTAPPSKDPSLLGKQASLQGSSCHRDTFSVFATGLENPRGLAFGSDGFLYVAEGGVGGNDSTTGECEQVPFPIGPYKGSPDGARISKISPQGVVTTFASGFPSTQSNPATGGLITGVADVKFLNGQLYALIAGGGCSHGNAGTVNGIWRVNWDGTSSMLANLSQFWQTHPVANPEADDFEPDGDPYSMIAVGNSFYVVEANHGEVDQVTLNGSISRLIDISASQGHVVPTSIAYHGNFYVGNLGTFPVIPGSENIYKITPSGNIKIDVSGLTSVLGVVFDNEKRMYVLEATTVAGGFPAPGTGCVIRVNPNGQIDTVTMGLTFPTALAIGPDGYLYISNFGFGFPPGMGEIVKVKISRGAHAENEGNGDDNGQGDDEHGKNGDQHGKMGHQGGDKPRGLGDHPGKGHK